VLLGVGLEYRTKTLWASPPESIFRPKETFRPPLKHSVILCLGGQGCAMPWRASLVMKLGWMRLPKN
jgi:hypothetical protein